MIDYTNAQAIIDYHSKVKTTQERTSLNASHKAIARMFYPDREYMIGADDVKDGKKNNLLFQSDTIKVADDFASNLLTTVVNPSISWFVYRCEDDELYQDQKVQEYYKKKTELTHKKLKHQKCNFQAKMLENFKEIGVFGDSVVYPFWSKAEQTLRFKLFSVANTYFLPDEENFIHDIHRDFQLTAKEIYEKWGEKVHEDVRKKALDPKQCFAKYNIINCVYKNNKYIKSSIKKGSFRYVSVFVDRKNKVIIDTEDFKTKPVAIFQWQNSDTKNQIYSSSCAEKALPDAKQYDIQTRDLTAVREVFLRPPVAYNAAFFEEALDMRAGGATPYQNKFGPNEKIIEKLNIVDPTAIQIMRESCNELKEGLDKLFYLQYFKTLRDPRATAFQVREVREENLRALSPFVSNLYSGFDPLLVRIHDLLEEEGVYDKLDQSKPAELDNQELVIDYINPTRESQKFSKMAKLQNALESTAGMAQVNPEVLDHVDFPKMNKDIYDILGTGEYIKSKEEVEEIQAERKKQRQQQQQVENATKQADASSKNQKSQQQNFMGM